MRVRKAVIPAAGLGTRFLPATKATPKEMIPLVDKPGIQYVVEEAVAAGIDDILIVTGRSKKTVEDHFDRAPELEATLGPGGKDELLAEVRAISEMAHVHFVRQDEPRGLGHAVGMARYHVGDEPFAVLLPDDLMAEGSTLLSDMIEACDVTGGSVVALKRFGPDQISSYGVVEPDRRAHRRGLCAHPAGWSRSHRPPRRPATWPSWAATCSRRPCSTASPRCSRAPAASCS